MMQGMPAPAAWSPMTLSSITTHSRGRRPGAHHHTTNRARHTHPACQKRSMGGGPDGTVLGSSQLLASST